MRYKRGLNTLIADASYDVAWTRMDGREFHQYIPADSPYAAQDQLPPASTEEYPWLSRGASVVLNDNTDPNQPVLLADNFRNLLWIQNHSSATGTDTAPNLYVCLDGPVVAIGAPSFVVRYSLRLQPNESVLFDQRLPNNSIYIAFFDGAGATATARGVLTYGRTQNSPPLDAASRAVILRDQLAAQQPAVHGIRGAGAG